MPSDPMSMELLREQEGRTVVRLSGPLTMANIFQLQSEVRADTSALLVIDLSAVPYVDSAGIGVLVGAHVARQKDGRKLVLVGVSERLRSALQVTNVEQFFNILPTLDDAMGKA